MDLNARGIVLALCAIFIVSAAPPRRTENEHPPSEAEEKGSLEELGIEYERYLRQVVEALETDQEFKRKLEAAEETDIRNGKIAKELEFVDHNVRTKLDELKRTELERLRHLAQKQFELTNGIDVEHMKIAPPEHLDHENPHTFEINDLKKLIQKVTDDLSEADKQRRQEFKEYEMQKEFEKNEKLKHLDGTDKEAFEKQLKDNETKHKQHDPLHHPGSKQQLEEVWEKQDHMENQDFDPKVFFQLHDLDGNGYWDQTEVKALFLKELDKMYQMGAPEDDMRERAEELERMREHVFKEADKNSDQLISYQEFLDQTKQPEFNKDPGWETVDQRPAYTHDEYMEFERRRQEEIQRMIQQGLIPPQPVYHQMPQGYHQPQMQQFPQGHHPAQAQYVQHPQQLNGQHAYPANTNYQPAHPNAIPQVHPNQLPQGHPSQMQGYGNQIPQGHPNQAQGYPNQVPVGHGNPMPAQVHPNQMQGHGNQIPQGGPNQYHAPQGQPNNFQYQQQQQPPPNYNQYNVQSNPNIQANAQVNSHEAVPAQTAQVQQANVPQNVNQQPIHKQDIGAHSNEYPRGTNDGFRQGSLEQKAANSQAVHNVNSIPQAKEQSHHSNSINADPAMKPVKS